MKFGPVPLEQAQGAILAHAVSAGGRRLKKGHVLDAADVRDLTNDRHRSVVVAQLELGDVPENDAAGRIAAALVEPDSHLFTRDAFTGRANIYARTGGCFLVDQNSVNVLNRVDPAITLATLHNGVVVGAGRMVATVKIIPFSVSERSLAAAEIACGRTSIRVAGRAVRRVGLVSTRLSSLNESVMGKTKRILVDRLSAYGVVLAGEMRVAHEEVALASAILDESRDCDLIIVFGASAIVDESDVIPAAIRRAGGRVHRFGMPVDPGNLLLTGTVAGTPVIGAPGCARSPVENGFDWVLRRVVHGVAIETIDLSAMGVGGLLMEIHDRPQPRDPGA